MERFEGDLKDQVGLLLKQLQQTLRAQMDAVLSDYDLTTPQYAVLAHLRVTPGLSNAELARRSFVTAPTMIRIVKHLEEAGYIQATQNQNHIRVIDMSLTKKGHQTVEKCESRVQGIQKRMLSDFSKSEATQFSKFLVRATAGLKD